MQEKKHEVIVSGVPKIENIPKDTIRIFCETVLREVEINCNPQINKSNDIFLYKQTT